MRASLFLRLSVIPSFLKNDTASNKPKLLSLLSTTGVYNPETKEESQRDLAELVQRDRNHPSVWAWNFCNEVNCNNDLATVQGMRNVSDMFDGTRPVTMNHLIDNPAEAYLNIQVRIPIVLSKT